MTKWVPELSRQIDAIALQMSRELRGKARAMSQADKIVSKIYHEIEFTPFGLIEGYHLASRLQVALVSRRMVKQEFAMVKSLADQFSAVSRRLRRDCRAMEQRVADLRRVTAAEQTAGDLQQLATGLARVESKAS